MEKNKKVIVIVGGSGQLGDVLFNQYDRERYVVINISRTKKLAKEGVINIRANITKKIDLLYCEFTLKSLVTRVDILVLGGMFIYHKDLFSLTKKELAYEFDVNVFSQIDVIKMMARTFWGNDTKEALKKCFYISSAVSLGSTERNDLQSYSVEKSSFNYVAQYLEKELMKKNVRTFLYMPGSLKNEKIRSAIQEQFWKDSLDEKRGEMVEMVLV